MANTATNDPRISSRYRFRAEKELRGMSSIANDKLKSIKMNGGNLDREKFLDLVSSIGKRNKRDVTVKDLERHLYYKDRYGLKIDFKNKQKLLAWVKERAAKMQPKTEATTKTKQPSFKDQGYDRKLASIPARYLGQSDASAKIAREKPSSFVTSSSGKIKGKASAPSLRQSVVQAGAKSGFAGIYGHGVFNHEGRAGNTGGRPFVFH